MADDIYGESRVIGKSNNSARMARRQVPPDYVSRSADTDVTRTGIDSRRNANGRIEDRGSYRESGSSAGQRIERQAEGRDEVVFATLPKRIADRRAARSRTSRAYVPGK